MTAETVGIGVLGFGGFGMFAAQQFAQVPGATLRCIAGTHRQASLACAARFGLEDVEHMDVLLARPDIELVYIATPPFLHFAQARAALHAGKHVIVEKPLAVTLEHADEIVSLARETRRLLVTNLMQRYNPLFRQVKALVDSKLLGDVLRGTHVTKAWGRITGSGSGRRVVEFSSSTECISSTCLRGGSVTGSSSRRDGCCVQARGSKSRSTAPRATVMYP